MQTSALYTLFHKQFYLLRYLLRGRQQLLVGFGQLRRQAVSRHPDRHCRAFQGVFHNHAAFRFADDDTDSRVFVRQSYGVVQHIQVKFHLAFILRQELADFQFNRYHGLQTPVEQQQIYEVFLSVHFYPVLVADKGEIGTELHEERADILYNRLFQFIFGMFFRKAHKVECIFVFQGKYGLALYLLRQGRVEVALTEQIIFVGLCFYLVDKHIFRPAVFLG